MVETQPQIKPPSGGFLMPVESQPTEHALSKRLDVLGNSS